MRTRVAWIAGLALVVLLAVVVIHGCGSSDNGSDTGGAGQSAQPKSGVNNPESDPLQHVTQGGKEAEQGCKASHTSGSSFTCTGSGGSSP